MNFILFSKATRQTGQALAAELGIKGGETVPEGLAIDFLIRWGSSLHPEIQANTTVNRPEAVALATNKFKALEALSFHSISVPKSISLQALEEQSLKAIAALGLRLPVLAREDNHTRGQDIVLCLQDKDVRRAIRWGKTHVTEYIPTKDEYRIHVFGNEIVKISRKALMSKENYVPHIRNDANSYVFKTTKIKLTDQHKQEAVDAVGVLGLDFGAVDLVVSDNDESFVLEVNTGPSLIDSGVEIYGNKFREILGG